MLCSSPFRRRRGAHPPLRRRSRGGSPSRPSCCISCTRRTSSAPTRSCSLCPLQEQRREGGHLLSDVERRGWGVGGGTGVGGWWVGGLLLTGGCSRMSNREHMIEEVARTTAYIRDSRDKGILRSAVARLEVPLLRRPPPPRAQVTPPTRKAVRTRCGRALRRGATWRARYKIPKIPKYTCNPGRHRALCRY